MLRSSANRLLGNGVMTYIVDPTTNGGASKPLVVPVEKVKDFQNKLTDFLNSRKTALLEKLRVEKAVSDALAGELKAAVTEFKQTYR